MAKAFIVFNGPASALNTGPIQKVATGASTKTMLQIKANASQEFDVMAWGCSFDASAAATPGYCELVATGTVAATVTASVSADVMPWNMPNDAATTLQVGASATGYTATVEGSITTARSFDQPLIDPALTPYFREWALGVRPRIPAGGILRVRMTFGATQNALCWVLIAEGGD